MSSITFGNYLRQGFVYYPLPYMELLPEFDCLDTATGQWSTCTKEDFCGKFGVHWRYNFDAMTSLHNWVEKLDLVC